MDPAMIGAVLLAVAGGAGSQLGTQLWEGVVLLVRRPFHRKGAISGDAEVVPAGEAELTALEQTPGDQNKAVALAEVLVARAGADDEFRRALELWLQQAEPFHARISVGNVVNTISGGTQHGPVLMGRDFSDLTFGASPATPIPRP